MNEGQSALLRKAHRALHAARRNLDEGDVETATNRAYYAAFHAACAALLSVGEIPRTHSGAVKRFGIHFVKTGQLSHTIGRVFSEALRHRLNADYDAFSLWRSLRRTAAGHLPGEAHDGSPEWHWPG